MPDKIRVLLVDIYAVTDTAVQVVLEKTNDLRLVASIDNSDQIAESCRIYNPHIILLASNAVTSLRQALEDLPQYCPQAKLLLLLTIDDKVHMPTLLEQGAAGFISKRSPAFRLTEAIRAIAAGNSWIDPTLLGDIFNPETAPPQLTDREKAVLKMLVAGKTDKEMALALKLSERTIRRDIDQLYLKLNTNTRVETTYKAGLLNLLE